MTSQLPVHSSSDIHLADAFGMPGCPLCRERARAEAAFLEAILAESVNDVGFRADLDAARGFCATHSRAVLDVDRRRAGSLGAAILLRATLRVRLAELAAVHRAGGRSRSKRLDAAARPPVCPVCARMTRTETGLIEGLVRLTAEPPWAEAVAAAPLCLDHLLPLMRAGTGVAAWPGIEARQLARLHALVTDLAGFAHASSHDRRHLLTDAHRASVALGVEALAGLATPGDGSRRADIATPVAGPTAAAVLLTGTYGSGKTTVAIELVDVASADGVGVAAIDLDWLGWYGADLGHDEHEDPRITFANLRAVRDTYVGAGVDRLVLAYALPSAGQLQAIRDALAMPVTVIRLEVPAAEIERRLTGDPNGSRADDLAVARRWLRDGVGIGLEDATVMGDRPPAAIAVEIRDLLGWTSPSSGSSGSSSTDD